MRCWKCLKPIKEKLQRAMEVMRAEGQVMPMDITDRQGDVIDVKEEEKAVGIERVEVEEEEKSVGMEEVEEEEEEESVVGKKTKLVHTDVLD